MQKKNIEYYSTQPASRKSSLLKLALRMAQLKKLMEYFSWSSLLISLSSTKSPIAALRRITSIRRDQIDNRTVYTLSPKQQATDTVVLYLHGGGFTVNFTRPHWNFIHHLIRLTHCTVVAPDFPLLPSGDYKARLDMVLKVYEHVRQTRKEAKIILMGDSSGGNTALALAQMLKESGQTPPDQVILLSPWLDVSMSDPKLKERQALDPMLSYAAAVKAGKAHAGQASTTFYQASPLYGQLKGIGTISLFTGTDDILYADAQRMKALAQAQEADFNYFEYSSMMHVWMLFDLPEAQLAQQQIAQLVNSD